MGGVDVGTPITPTRTAGQCQGCAQGDGERLLQLQPSWEGSDCSSLGFLGSTGTPAWPPCHWGSDSGFAPRQVQPGKKPGRKWDLIEVSIPQLTRSR